MLFSKKDLFKIIVPLIIQQLLTVTIGMADSIMVAYAGEAAVSGVSLVNTLDVLLVLVFNSLVSGGSVVISQALGTKNAERARDASKQLFFASAGIAALLSMVIVVVRVPLLKLLYDDVEAAVMFSAEQYLLYMALSFPFLAMENTCAAMFRVMGNSFVSMVVSIVMNFVNVGGNALLIIGFEMGAAGAAIASLIARIGGAAVLILLLRNKKRILYLDNFKAYRPNMQTIKSILHIGVPNGIENGMFQFGKILTQSLISSMGTAAIAANAVANTLATFQYMPGQATGATMVTVVGRCIGANEKKQAAYYTRILVIVTYVCIWIISALTFVLAKPIINVYNVSAEAGEIAYQMILPHALIASAIWPIAFTLPHAFRAASDVKYPLVISMLSMWAFRVALSYVFACETVNVFGLFSFSGLNLGAIGVWFAMGVDWLFRGTLFVVHYVRGRWTTVYERMHQKDAA